MKSASRGFVRELAASGRFRDLAVSTTVLAGGALGTVLIQAFALRLMSAGDTGLLVLCLGVISVASTAGTLGTSQLVPRLVAANPESSDIRGHLLVLIAALAIVAAAVVVALLLLLAVPLKALGLLGGALLAAAIAIRSLQYVEAAFRRGIGFLTSGAVVQQGAAVITAGLMAVGLIAGWKVDPTVVIALFLVCQLGLLFGSIAVWRPGFSGLSASRWLNAHKPQLIGYWGAAVVTMGFLWADRLVVGAVLPLEDLATYQSILLTTALFEVLAVGIGYVHLPRYAVIGHRSGRDAHLVYWLAGIAAITTVLTAFLVGGPMFLLKWSPETVAVVLILTFVGVAKLLYADLSSTVGGLADVASMRRFVWQMFATLLVGLVATAWLTVVAGLVGAAFGSALVWSVRVAICHMHARRWGTVMVTGGDAVA